MEGSTANRNRPAVRTERARQYALAYFRRRVGPWRWSKEQVEGDALRRGDASRDRGSMAVYLTVPADILERWVWIELPADDAAIPPPLRAQLRLVE